MSSLSHKLREVFDDLPDRLHKLADDFDERMARVSTKMRDTQRSLDELDGDLGNGGNGHPEAPSGANRWDEPDRPGFNPSRTPRDGDTDGGPGAWGPSSRDADGAGMPFQQRVTGADPYPDNRVPEYFVDADGVRIEFDGHVWRDDTEVFLEAKGDFSKWADPNHRWADKDKLLDKWRQQLERQLDGLPDGAQLEWHLHTPELADEFADLVRDFPNVTVYYHP